MNSLCINLNFKKNHLLSVSISARKKHSALTNEPSVSLKYNQQDAKFSRSIYFYKLLYVFQAVPAFHLIHDVSRQQYWFDDT